MILFPNTPGVAPMGVGGVTLHRFKVMQDLRGNLSVGEFSKEIPFNPKRYFLVYNLPARSSRGDHAHYHCHQFLICLKGSCAVTVDDGQTRGEVRLESPDVGIYLPPMTWSIQNKYSNDAIIIVFASDYYETNDYIRNYAEFVDIAKRANHRE